MSKNKVKTALGLVLLWLGISITTYALAREIVSESHIEKVRKREYKGGVDEQNIIVQKDLPKIRRMSDRELQERFISSEEEEPTEEQEEPTE